MNLKNLRNPDLYHGRLGKNYLEGWYFKLVDGPMKNAFAFIPGVFFSSGGGYDHAFIQLVDGVKRTYHYERFDKENFSAAKDVFQINLASSSFGRSGLDFKLTEESTPIKGRVDFSNHLDWPDSLLNPGSMGFYNYILKMQCYSHVCAMDFDLSGGKGYIEKNWGAAFPVLWVNEGYDGI